MIDKRIKVSYRSEVTIKTIDNYVVVFISMLNQHSLNSYLGIV